MTKTGDTFASLVATLRGKCTAFILARLKEEGITELAVSHGSILAVLYCDGPQPMAVLSERTSRDKSTVTVLVRKLEALGYVKRETGAQDGRVSVIRLTEKGVRFQPVFERISVELNQRIWGDMPEGQKEALCRNLAMISERL